MAYSNSSNLDCNLQPNGLLKILLNRPQKRNAMKSEMTKAITTMLNRAANDSKVKVFALSGTGDYFTSGNDFGSIMNESEYVEENDSIFNRFIAALIDFPKPLIAIVNGLAVGMGVTMLAHFDLVISSDKATFHTPFTTLEVVAEGCSSYLFPILMGYSKAADMLIFDKKISAEEALKRNLVTEVVPHSELPLVWDRVNKIASYTLETTMRIKKLLKPPHLIDTLHEINNAECKELMIATESDAFLEAIFKKFFNKKSKL